MVADYAAVSVYTWSTDWTPPLIVTFFGQNQAIGSNGDDCWRRICAAQLANTSFRRWRILVDFEGAASVGIGISCAAVDDESSSNDRFVVFPDLFRHPTALINGGRYAPSTSNQRRFMVPVEFDPKYKTINIGFQKADGSIDFDQQSPSNPAGDWRPAVFVVGAVRATILSWPDD